MGNATKSGEATQETLEAATSPTAAKETAPAAPEAVSTESQHHEAGQPNPEAGLGKDHAVLPGEGFSAKAGDVPSRSHHTDKASDSLQEKAMAAAAGVHSRLKGDDNAEVCLAVK